MRRFLPYLLVAATALGLYARTATFGFVRADDEDLILGNQAFLSDLRNVPRAFTRSYFEIENESTLQKTYYRPMAIVSFMVDAAIGGTNPRPYHATNAILHAIASCLLVTLAVAWGAPRSAALVAGLIFAVHPVNVHAVAWVAGRNDLLLAVFGLLSLLSWPAPHGRGSQPIRVVLHVTTFALALLAKESAIVLPLLAVLYQRLARRQPLTPAQGIALACDAAVLTAWLFVRAHVMAGAPSELSNVSVQAFVTNLPHLLVHAGKMLAPIGLNVSPGADTKGLLLGALAVLGAAALAWRSASRGHALVAACWVLAFLLPTLAVPALPAYEHRVYLPLIGILAAVAASARGLALHTWTPYATAVVVVALATVTVWRQDIFRDPFTYWTDGTRDAQFGPLAHVNLGLLHEGAGRTRDARREYLRALERDPNTPKAHNNLGVVLMSLNEPELAIMHFKEETRRHPWNADAWFNLGLWMETSGDLKEARRCYERAAAANPSYRPALEKLK